MRAPRDHRESGFALVESIAVLALSGLVLLGLVVASSLVTRNSAAAARRANAVEVLSTGLDALRRDIAGARLVRMGEDPQGPILFEGGAETLAFVVGDDGSGGPAAESLVRIEARDEGSEAALVRSSAPLTPQTIGIAGATIGDPAILIAGPWRYRFAYAGVTSEPLTWQEVWTDAKVLPDLVRLEIFNRAGDRRMLPPVVIDVHVDAEVPCEGDNCGTEEEAVDDEELTEGEPEDGLVDDEDE